MRKMSFFSPLVVVAVVAIVIVAAVGLYLVYGGNEGDDDIQCVDGTGGAGPVSATHGIGSGDADFWTSYPYGHVRSGEAVSFPSWVQSESSSKVLLICDHSEGCAPCETQGADIASIMADQKYAQGVNFMDLLSTSSDPRAQECFDVFDPNGEQPAIPLTIIVVKHSDGRMLWHSWEGVTGMANLMQWLDDAMAYRGG